MNREQELTAFNRIIKTIRKNLNHLPKKVRLNAIVIMRKVREGQSMWSMGYQVVEVINSEGKVIENFIFHDVPFSCKVHLWGDK